MSSEGWQLDHDAARQAFEVLRSAECVCFPTHQNVDADGVSSALAMLDGLRRRGGNGFVLISDGRFPRYLSFLPGSEQVANYDWTPTFDINGACIWFYIDQSEVAFTPGTWRVQMALNGSPVGSAAVFSIVEANPPGDAALEGALSGQGT